MHSDEFLGFHKVRATDWTKKTRRPEPRAAVTGLPPNRRGSGDRRQGKERAETENLKAE
jgi:hypothetical protein